jgi:hypothetical protein
MGLWLSFFAPRRKARFDVAALPEKIRVRGERGVIVRTALIAGLPTYGATLRRSCASRVE